MLNNEKIPFVVVRLKADSTLSGSISAQSIIMMREQCFKIKRNLFRGYLELSAWEDPEGVQNFFKFVAGDILALTREA